MDRVILLDNHVYLLTYFKCYVEILKIKPILRKSILFLYHLYSNKKDFHRGCISYMCDGAAP